MQFPLPTLRTTCPQDLTYPLLGNDSVYKTKQSSPRAASSISTARPVNTATPKPKVNDALPVGNKSSSRVNTAKVYNVTMESCALRNFDLEVMELENTQNNALAKLPMLKLGEYEMWEIRIKQYFHIQDYALWEVIENGNSWVPILVTTPSETGTSTATKMIVPSTIEEKTCKKNDVKARTSDEELEELMKDQPLSADASPTALSPGYIADSNPEEDKEDPEEDPADHPADG
ncbi:hypothetical protein Tco_0250943 [Tanacetum coccineum]